MEINKIYKGSIVTIGKITFNTLTANEKDYQYYFDNGFSYLFIEGKVVKEEVINKLEQAKKEVKNYAKKKQDKR